MASNTTVKFIKLESSDKKVFVIAVPVARQSQLIHDMIEDMKSFTNIEGYHLTLPITAEILEKVIAYCEKHTQGASSSTALNNWDKQFVDLDPAMLDELLTAAYRMKIDGLRDLVCQKKADMTKDKGKNQ